MRHRLEAAAGTIFGVVCVTVPAAEDLLKSTSFDGNVGYIALLFNFVVAVAVSLVTKPRRLVICRGAWPGGSTPPSPVRAERSPTSSTTPRMVVLVPRTG